MAKKLGTLKVKRLFLGVDGAGQGTELTATADELNVLDGVTSDVNELNILNGATVSAGELNSLASAWVGDFTTAFVDGADGTGVVTITLKTAAGGAIAGAHSGIIYIADAATGLALSTITSLETATKGFITIVDTGAAEFYRFVTDATGAFDATLTAAAGSYYCILVGPQGQAIASSVCTITDET